MTLSIKQMDDINVLLTEVALGLLGNQFYDIYGKNQQSFVPLLSKNLTQQQNWSFENCDLVKSLEINENVPSNQSKPISENIIHQTKQTKKIRRLSGSHEIKIAENNRHSLRKTASIKNRRNTTYPSSTSGVSGSCDTVEIELNKTPDVSFSKPELPKPSTETSAEAKIKISVGIGNFFS